MTKFVQTGLNTKPKHSTTNLTAGAFATRDDSPGPGIQSVSSNYIGDQAAFNL